MTTIDLDTLTKALEQVNKEVGYREKEYRIGDHLRITLCSLPATVEVQVQKAAKSAIDEGDKEDPATFADYVDRLRLGTLAHSVIGVNDNYFREEKVSTGEFVRTSKGEKKPITEDRPVVVRRLIQSWPRNLIISLFECFDELMGEIEAEVGKYVQFDPIKIEKEIDRLERRVTELKDRRMKLVKGRQPDFVEKQRKVVVESGKAESVSSREEVAKAMFQTAQNRKAEKAPSAPPAPEALPVSVEEAENIMEQAPPPPRRPQAPVRQVAQPPRPEKGPLNPRDLPPPRDDSMIDWDNPDASIEAENQRLMQQRAARFREQRAAEAVQTGTHELPPRQNQPEAIRAPRNPRRPPHHTAAQIANQALEESSMSEAQAYEERDRIIQGGEEIPVFAFNQGTLERTPPLSREVPPAPVEHGSRNPNFVSPRNRR